MHCLAVVLTVLGGVLTLAAIAKATTDARKRFGQLNRDLDAIKAVWDALGPQPSMAAQQAATEQTHTIRPPSVSTFYWVEYGPETAQRDVFRELARPAILAALGIAFATAGAVIALYL